MFIAAGDCEDDQPCGERQTNTFCGEPMVDDPIIMVPLKTSIVEYLVDEHYRLTAEDNYYLYKQAKSVLPKTVTIEVNVDAIRQIARLGAHPEFTAQCRDWVRDNG